MKKLELKYILRLNTPAFLGDAFQKGQWRTPPFKALLRQWWRVIKACELLKNGNNPENLHSEVREAEGKLFGHAWLEDSKGKKWAMQSRIEMRLKSWEQGQLEKLKPSEKKIHHKEVNFPIDPFLYLGYGPIEYDKPTKGIRLKNPPAIRENSSNLWTLLGKTISNGESREIEEAMKLIHLFGTIGGRSRNGWGSLILQSRNGQELPELSKILDKNNTQSRKWLSDYSRDLSNALDFDWCHAIGRDEKGLLFWRSKKEFPSWGEAMRHLAEVKIKLRTQFHFKGAGPHFSLCDRQILAYPVTKHLLDQWEKENGKKKPSRSANQLFFKVHRVGSGFVPIIVHLPHGIPKTLEEKLNPADKNGLGKREEDVWKKVHKVLDQEMQRLS
jgi:CRISPR-associated protein Cmr1